MKFKFNSKISVEIYENQLKSYVCINGRPYIKKSINYQLYNQLLSILNISINIINPDKRKTNLKLKEILLKSLIFYKKEKHNEKNKKEKSKINPKSKSLIFKKILIFPILLILITFIIFLLDFSSIQTKINSENLSKINSLKTDYDLNKCETNGNLSSLHSYCNNLKSQIVILQKKTPTLLSTFFIWILDILNSIYYAMGIKNVLITTFFIILIKKII